MKSRKVLVVAVIIWGMVVAINFLLLPRMSDTPNLDTNLGMAIVPDTGGDLPKDAQVWHWGHETDLVEYRGHWSVSTDAGYAIVISQSETRMTLTYIGPNKVVGFGLVRPHVGLLGSDNRPSVIEFRSETEAWEYASGMVDAFSDYDPQIVWEES